MLQYKLAQSGKTETNKKVAIDSMPGIFRYTSDLILKEVEQCLELGLTSFALFPCIEEAKKDSLAKESYNPDCQYLITLADIKKRFGEDIVIISDVAMDPYSSDGHDGIVENDQILNDPTLEVLAKMALAQCHAGTDGSVACVNAVTRCPSHPRSAQPRNPAYGARAPSRARSRPP